MAIVALVAKIVVLPLLARRAPQLLVELSVLSLVALGMAIYAIVLARRAEDRLMLTRDKRHLMTAHLGLWVGSAVVIYTVASFVFSLVTNIFWPIREGAHIL
jgi:Flp pilus assembly protein protease CpaA